MSHGCLSCLWLCAVGLQGAVEGQHRRCEDHCASRSHEWPREARKNGNYGGRYQQRPQPPQHHAGVLISQGSHDLRNSGVPAAVTCIDHTEALATQVSDKYKVLR